MKMKKLIAIVLTVSALCALFALSAAAATEQEVLDMAKTLAPEAYKVYGVTLENAMDQLDLTAAQCDELIALGKDVAAKVDLSKNVDMDQYSAEDQSLILDALAKGCEICNLTYKIVPSADPVHPGDSTLEIYRNGQIFTTVDADVINATMVAETAAADCTVMAIAAVVTALVAVCGFAYSRKFN